MKRDSASTPEKIKAMMRQNLLRKGHLASYGSSLTRRRRRKKGHNDLGGGQLAGKGRQAVVNRRKELLVMPTERGKEELRRLRKPFLLPTE